jgi:hypothetical protein
MCRHGPGKIVGFVEVVHRKNHSAWTERTAMLILLALLLVLLFFGLGFTLHALWIVAIVLFVAWLIGLVIGRGESAGRNHFYRW